MKETNCIEKNTQRRHANGAESGDAIKPLSKEQPSFNGSETGKNERLQAGFRPLVSLREAAKMMGCHWQTLLYRERKGQLTPVKVDRRKHYYRHEIEKLRQTKPVSTRPRWIRKQKDSTATEKIAPVNYTEMLREYSQPYRPEPKPKSFWQKLKFLFGF